MELVELTEFLVKSLVKDQDSISVKQIESEEDFILIEVIVNENDIGKVIGSGGKIANSIRTLVQACAYTNYGKKVRINIDSL